MCLGLGLIIPLQTSKKCSKSNINLTLNSLSHCSVLFFIFVGRD
jgi:hypothetical protein